tara:strand:- start:651 stop:1637 length:987 start_codon:yes stop_codon:yes gene_type:complete
MLKKSLKKLFIKISRLLGYELIDQNNFVSPTLNKELNENLTSFNEKSIVLPLGEVNITRKVKSLLIIFRTNSNVEIWDQNKRRIFEEKKIVYVEKALNTLIKSINASKKDLPSLELKLIVLDDNSTKNNLDRIKKITETIKIKYEIINHDISKYKNLIKNQKTRDTYSNLSSLLTSFYLGRDYSDDLIFFVEDDYLHFEGMITEVVKTFERISSQIGKDIFICPSDYPYFYMNNEKTNILIGDNRHWRTINKTLCTFFTSKKLLNKYWSNFEKNCMDRHDPFEKYLNEIYEKELCISPLKSLSIHMTNINSSYGLSPFIDYRKIWSEN